MNWMLMKIIIGNTKWTQQFVKEYTTNGYDVEDAMAEASFSTGYFPGLLTETLCQ